MRLLHRFLLFHAANDTLIKLKKIEKFQPRFKSGVKFSKNKAA